MRNEICISSKFNYRNTISRTPYRFDSLPLQLPGASPVRIFRAKYLECGEEEGKSVCVCVFFPILILKGRRMSYRVEMGRDEIFYLNLCIKQRLL